MQSERVSGLNTYEAGEDGWFPDRKVILMLSLNFSCLDEVVPALLRLLDEEGEESRPRGMTTRELLNVSFKLSNPRSRLVCNQERGWSLPLAVGEFLWHLSGSRDAGPISYFAPAWIDLSRGGEVSGSCYGFKIFHPVDEERSQWDLARDLLTDDPDTRRAVIRLYDERENIGAEVPDVACASLLQFFVRRGKLNMTVYMRSNDIIWGLPYDCFVFTMFQEMMAEQLGYELGEYVHFAGSLHLYERHFSLSERMLEADTVAPCASMPPMDLSSPVEEIIGFEKTIREQEPMLDFSNISTYWRDLLLILSFHKAKKTGSIVKQTEALEAITDSAYRQLLCRRFPAAAY